MAVQIVSPALIGAFVDSLLKAQNPDGGWGAEEGRSSNTEATSLAVLGLTATADRSLSGSIDRGIRWLGHRQQPDGGWSFTPDIQEPSWASALAIVALSGLEAQRDRALRGARWLLDQGGSRPGWFASLLYRLWPQRMPVRLNPDLRGWAWARGAFSWVEPTSYALIALKKLRRELGGTQVAERIREGELLLYDRMCEGGGWNYGNSNVLGENLLPYPDTTAVALIALQDHRTADRNRVGLQALQGMLREVESGFTLGWAILCFAIYHVETAGSQRALARAYEKTRFLGASKTLALALLASTNGHAALTV